MKFIDQVAFITGASGGIGRATTERFLKEGAIVIAADLNAKMLDQLNRDFKPEYENFSTTQLDVSEYNQVQQTIDKTISTLGRLDILVNNAGLSPKSKNWLESDIEEWHNVININLSGEYFCARSAAKQMIKQNQGRIINISSSAWRHGGVAGGGGVSYTSSKAGVIGLTRSLAKSLGMHGITVNAIAPGPTHSPMTTDWLPDREDSLNESIPLGRVGQPKDNANAFCFLASNEASYITGQCLDVNGGLTFS